ncbi:GNAT family N-acetyltransferase [Vallitalea guaymasensis]|uniref:GNAT family N-acetyltransferase n=1 Tax=Vallitalea guaymasensis TaxID=1185412 RepID=A0A8J8SCG8_9FIRM|nr:GNAT family N-acetyltransferase [Vallitalea guaymasensis]QUH29737.1 GNAT family N-acetyltransferase [Vallitalea guaymasensis]
MKFKFVKYKSSYTLDAAKMMRKTWHYDKCFEGIKDNIYFYKIFFKYSMIASDYHDLIVDENDKLVGILMARSINKKKLSLNYIGLGINFIFRWLTGEFGKRIQAIKNISIMVKDNEKIMKDVKKYDNEITLFFVDENTRGNGLGKKLMNRYINYCKNQGIRNIILMTDAGCNYGFYEHYGFKRINAIHSDLFAKPEIEYNGFAYAYEAELSIEGKID